MAHLQSCIPELLSTLEHGPHAIAILRRIVSPYGPFDIAIHHAPASDLSAFLGIRSEISALLTAVDQRAAGQRECL